MRDYSNYGTYYQVDMRDYSGKWIFEEQLKQEGSIVKVIDYVDDIETEYNVIARKYGNDQDNEDEFRSMCFYKEFPFKKGDYIGYLDDIWMITTHIDKDNPFYNMCKMTLCNNVITLKYENKNYNFPCILSNDSYGSKQSKSDDRIMTDDSKAKLYVQMNEITNKIKKSQRFIFSKSEDDIYSVVDITKSIYKNTIQLILKKEVLRNEDDLENNIGYNKDSNINYNIDIIGEDTIILNKETIFTINNDENVNVVWSINNSNAIIISSNNNRCIVKGLVRNKVFKLTCKDTSGNLISEKNIGITI